MPPLLYILGSGRSGSTVVERVLNTSARAVAVGEVHALWRLPVDTLLCSCGARVPDCAFWQDALERAGIDGPMLTRLSALERKAVRNTYLARLRFDPARIRADARLAEFIELNRRLFEGIRAARGASMVIDSSKAGPRAWVLAAGLQPLILHIHRRAGDVITSWRRPKHEPATGRPMRKPPVATAALDWIKAEQTARSLVGIAQLRRIDHEGFAKAPRPTLHQSLDAALPGFVDSLPWAGPSDLEGGADYHSVLGNPDRYHRGPIRVRPQPQDNGAPLPRGEARVIKAVGRILDGAYR